MSIQRVADLDKIYPLEWFRRRTHSKKGPHISSVHLADLIYKKFKPKRVIDLGAGTLSFANRMAELGARSYGVEGSQFNEEFAEGARFIAHDLRQPLLWSREKCDLVTSFEVFEHIPESSEKALVKTVKNLASRWVVLSISTSKWGRDHVNCKPLRYWRKLFGKAGFIYDEERTQDLKEKIMADERITSKWYARNLSVFKLRYGG